MYTNVQLFETPEQPMRQVSFTEFRRNAASLFDSVEQGETIVVLRHGKPIAVATDGKALLAAAGVPPDSEGVTVTGVAHLASRLIADLAKHRFPRRVFALRPS